MQKNRRAMPDGRFSLVVRTKITAQQQLQLNQQQLNLQQLNQ